MERIFTTREEWLKERGDCIGASEIGALLCSDHRLTPFKLSAQKLHLAPDEEESKAMRRGRLLEDDAIQCIREDNPTWDVRHNVLPRLHHWSSGRIGATPDAFVTIPDREGEGVLQVKSVGDFAFRKNWLEDGAIVPPTWIAIQATVEAALTGCKYAFVAPLRASNGLDIDAIEIPIVHSLLDRAQAAADAFWEKIDRGEMYEPDFARDGSLIEAVFWPRPDSKIDLSGDNQVYDLAVKYKLSAERAKAAKDMRDQIKNEMLFKMNGNSEALVDGEVFATASVVNRKPYTVKASSYTVLKFKDNGA